MIEAAAFCAFVPFVPITAIALQGFEPFERRRIVARVPAERVDFTQRAPRSLFETLTEPEPQSAEMGSAPIAWPVPKSSPKRWVGNVNIYIDGAPEQGVELHQALDLKLPAGEEARILFIIADATEVEVKTTTSNPDWSAATETWASVGKLLVTPPSRPGSQASIEVLVTRKTDGKTVKVEFGFETVDGEGDTLGCVTI